MGTVTAKPGSGVVAGWDEDPGSLSVLCEASRAGVPAGNDLIWASQKELLDTNAGRLFLSGIHSLVRTQYTLYKIMILSFKTR